MLRSCRVCQESQAYPPDYGAETARLIRDTVYEVDTEDSWCLHTLRDECCYYRENGLNQWADADLGGVWKMVLK
jgi:hypothetical protein